MRGDLAVVEVTWPGARPGRRPHPAGRVPDRADVVLRPGWCCAPADTQSPGERRSHRIDHPVHDPCVLANLPAAGESELFEEFDGRAEQETALRRAAGGHLGDGLDEAAAGIGDLVESAFQ